MLSRRSIRVKVMQHLYMLNRDKELTPTEVYKRYLQLIENSFEMYLFNLYIVEEICHQSVIDAEKRQSKHLKVEEDKSFSSKLYHNPSIQNILNHSNLRDYYLDHNFEDRIDVDFIKKTYKSFSKTEAYKEYLNAEDSENGHKEILLELYRHCRRSEYFNDIMMDLYFNWEDDKSLVVGVMKKTLKEIPAEEGFYLKYYTDEETFEEYGLHLLKEVVAHDEELLEIISPIIENWDVDRMAMVDIIFLKMATCEFLFFPSIPTKVTLNEYVDLAKSYSTEKSKDFINGILDKTMRSMDEKGAIKKSGRGLVT